MGNDRWDRGQASQSRAKTAALLLAVPIAIVVLGTGVRAVYRGPGVGVADRVRDAHSPIVTQVVFVEPNPFEGASGEVRITLKHDASRDEVNAFWCDVVVPAGGADLYITRYLWLLQADQRAGEPGRFEPDPQCPPSVLRPTPTPPPTPGPPTPPPFVPAQCTSIPSLQPADCRQELAAVQAAVSGLGHDLRSIVIHPFGFPCGEAFETERAPETCPSDTSSSTAYVRFKGTDKVAALSFKATPAGLAAVLVAFEVAPPNFSYWLGP